MGKLKIGEELLFPEPFEKGFSVIVSGSKGSGSAEYKFGDDNGSVTVSLKNFTGELKISKNIKEGLGLVRKGAISKSVQDIFDSLMAPSPKKTITKTGLTKKIAAISTPSESEDKAEANAPEPRWGCSVSAIGDKKIMVFGGQSEVTENSPERILNDLHIYDVVDEIWTTPIESEGTPRCWHTATFLPKSGGTLVFGGKGPDGEIAEPVVFDSEINLWYPLSATGKPPTARMGHTANLLGDGLYIFGGSKLRKWKNDVHILDTKSWQWYSPKITGAVPAARVYHKGVSVNENRIIYFGGNGEEKSFNDTYVLTVYNAGRPNASHSWSSPIIVGHAPDPRCGHVMSIVKEEQQIIVFGGWDTQKTDDQPPFVFSENEHEYVLDIEHWEWHKIANPPLALPGCTGSGFAHTNEKLFIFGGQGSGPSYPRNNKLTILNPSSLQLSESENFVDSHMKKNNKISQFFLKAKRKCTIENSDTDKDKKAKS